MSQPVTFGIAGINYLPHDVLQLAQAMEELRFDILWWGEHYLVPSSVETSHPTGDKGTNTKVLSDKSLIYDLYCLLGAVAASTKTLKIGTAVNLLPLNPPLLLARSTSTLHDVSQGRFVLGAGGGWAEEEFVRLGVPFNERGSRLDETIEILQKAWNGGFFLHSGKHFSFDALQISPHPIRIPLIIGGNSPPALRRAAAVGDGWITSGRPDLDQTLRLRDAIEAERRRLGRDRRNFEYYIRASQMTEASITAFIRQGFTNFLMTLSIHEDDTAEDVGLGRHLWHRDPSVSLDDKRARLRDIAHRLGVGMR